jgi:hypothetical protein
MIQNWIFLFLSSMFAQRMREGGKKAKVFTSLQP